MQLISDECINVCMFSSITELKDNCETENCKFPGTQLVLSKSLYG